MMLKPENLSSFNGLIKSTGRHVGQSGFNLTASLKAELLVKFSVSLFGCKINKLQSESCVSLIFRA